ncbi:MAG: hypothetical protein D6814_09210 [Calditrichaeota bacterium]|nr:MAG: hypothetical protein D6814_09210 [Calditrichota bacterium]
MNLGQKITEKLHLMQRMEDQMNFSVRSAEGADRGYHLSETENGIRVDIHIPDQDKYSFVVAKIELENTNFQPDRKHGVKPILMKQAKFIEKHVSYLPETFSLIELDENRQVAQMRSTKPYQKEKVTQYYELMLHQGKRLQLTRYEKKQDEPARQPIHFLLTEEILARLINDLGRAFKFNK